MPKGGKLGRGVNPTPRRVTKPTPNQERFALLYAETGDADAALDASGYAFPTPEAKRAAKSRLLRHPKVAMMVEEVRMKAVEKHTMNAAGVLLRFHVVYVEAMRTGDLSTAVQALREIGKFHGIYEKHNTQKAYTQADVERLRKELEQAGFDFTRIALKPSEN